MRDVISLVLGNFTVTCLVLWLAAAAIAIGRHPAPRSRALVYEELLRWFLFFGIGVSMLFNFVMHVFFHEMTARIIGWDDSPFQIEVGLASLGFAAVGFLAWRRGWEVRLAAILGPACFLVGAGVVHLYQIATVHNMAPGNAGSVLYLDFLGPAIGFVLLWLAYRSAQDGARVPLKAR
jgi:hypothetical protein